jgi:hypothetical protein
MQIQMLLSNSMILVGAGFMLTSIVLSLKTDADPIAAAFQT